MKKLKYILLIITMLLFLSGCDLNYKVVINKDLTTNEELNITADNSLIKEMIEKYGDDYINENISQYKTYFEGNNYTFKYSKGDNITGTATKRNKEFYINERIMKGRYNYYDFSCNNKYCFLYAVADNNIISGDGSGYDMKLSIQVPYKVIENNADEVDKINNIYTWYSKSTNDNKDIELLFYKTGKDIIKQNKTLYFIMIGIFAIIGLSIIVGTISIIKRVKNSNKPMI